MLTNITRLRVDMKKGGSGGGGMGNVIHEQFNIGIDTTSITLANNVAAGGNAIWASYEGQNLVINNHISVSGKELTINFPVVANSTHLDVTYVRSGS